MIALGLIGCFYLADVDLSQQNCDTNLCRYEKTAEDLSIWEYAYKGDYNLTHKKLLMREQNTMEHLYINHMIMAYLYYRRGDEESMKSMFRSIDRFIYGNARSER
jgi:hypothetical protein